MRYFRSAALSIAALSAIAAVPASAQSVAGIDAMRQYNLIVLGDLQSSSEVEGRTFVGGNLSGGSSNYQFKPIEASPYGIPGLTVVGDVTGGHKNLDRGSGVIVGGNVTSGFNFNGGTHTAQIGGTLSNTNINQNQVTTNLATTEPAFLVNLNQQKSLLTSSLTDLSQSLKGLDSNSNVTIANNRATFNSTPVDGVAVFNLTADQLNQFQEIDFKLNGADTAIINVSGQLINLNDNFLGGTQNLGENVIWNFPDATQVDVHTAWGGSVLAPTANGQTRNYIQGSAVFGSLKQDGEMHVGTYNGSYNPPVNPPTPPVDGPTPIPEEALGLFGLGALGLLWARRRKAKKQAVSAI